MMLESATYGRQTATKNSWLSLRTSFLLLQTVWYAKWPISGAGLSHGRLCESVGDGASVLAYSLEALGLRRGAFLFPS
jgi:hypothetical protein